MKALDQPDSLTRETEDSGTMLMRSADQDLLLSDDSEREIISNANDVSGKKVNGNQVGCEWNDQGRSREERQSDGIGRLERLERYERLGEVERSEPLGEVERSLGEVKRPLGEVERSLGEVERPLGEVERSLREVERSLGEVERESLKSWLAQFSAHIHLPRAYQVHLRPFLKYCPRRTLAFAFDCLQNNSAGEPVQS